MQIKNVEELVGITRKNIRFYEAEGLITPSRDENNRYREYSQADVDALMRIKLLRRLGVPIDDIRRLRAGEITLPECMRLHEAGLVKKAGDLEHARSVCAMMREDGSGFDNLCPEPYFEAISEMEKGGATFVDVSKCDMKSRKRSSALSACVIIFIMLAVMAFMIWGYTVDPIPVPILIGLLIIPASIIAGVVIVLMKRLGEIEKGDEDAASEY